MPKYDIVLEFLDVEGDDESDAFDRLYRAMLLSPAYDFLWVDANEVPEEEE